MYWPVAKEILFDLKIFLFLALEAKLNILIDFGSWQLETISVKLF